MFYENSIPEIRRAILEVDPHAIAKEESELTPGEKAPLGHLLWMCDHIEAMNTKTIFQATKAGRWIGWIYAHVEMHKLLSNQKVRSITRMDVRLTRDVPH